MLNVMLYAAIAIAVLMLIVWTLSLLRRDASIVDIAWGFGFVVVAWTCFASGQNSTAGDWLIPVLTTLWGLRLTGYLAWRNHGKPEDYRYQAMRKNWGAMFPIVSLVTVYGLQGVIMWIVSLPVQSAAAHADTRWIGLQIAGIALFAAGLAFEGIGDWQLARFKSDSNNAGKVMDRGLWRYTRHPNYFGDATVWWGLYLIAVSQGAQWWTAIGPAVMNFFLIWVSGARLLEIRLRKAKPMYLEYVQRTNAFFPGPPRKA